MKVGMIQKSNWLSSLTRGDKILIIVVLFCSALSLFAVPHLQTLGDAVIIEVDGMEVHHYQLTDDVRISVHGPIGVTVVEISGGTARVLRSDCREKICVKSGLIHRSGQLIVCAPNKVVVRIISKKRDQSFDAVTE